MTVPQIKVKVVRRPLIKVKALVKFPANVVTQNFLTVVNSGGTYTFSIDYTRLGPGPIVDPTTAFVAVLDATSGSYKEVTLASLLTSGLDADLQAIAALTGTGILTRTAANTWAVRTITAGALIGVTNGDGVAGNPTIAVTDAELVALAGLTSAADQLPYFTGLGTAALASFPSFGRSIAAAASQAAARTVLALTPGTDVQAFDSDLAALAANAGTGLWSVTGVGTGSVRTITGPAAGITVTNGGGVAGNPTLALANDLAALEGLASTGFAARTTTDTWAQRTIQVPAAGLTVSNPAGIAGDPTFALANDLAALEGLASTGIARRTGTDAWSVGTAVSNAELATMAAFTFKGNNTSGSAVPTDVDIAALTTKASPAAGDYAIISDQAASGAWKKATVSSLASAGSVSSIAGNTGAFTLSTGITNSTNDIRLVVPVTVANGGTGYTGGAWTGYAPTITSTGGTPTTVTASGSFLTIGKLVHFTVTITVTTIGTATGKWVLPLPTGTAARNFVAMVSENAGSGKSGSYVVTSGSSSGNIAAYDNSTTFITNGFVLYVTGIYELS